MKIYDPEIDAPIQKGNCDYERPLAPSLNPIITFLPQGPSYTINNNVVEWCGWKFTWSIDPVVGLSLYNISFLDRTVWRENPNLEPVRRSILYKASIGEVLTCYGDATISGSIRNFYDFYEYIYRDFSVELIPGIDVPEYASLFETIFTDVDGTVNTLPNRVGIYEKNAGMLWRHTDDLIDGRSGRELVVTFISVISNYDYNFEWTFTQDGEIRFDMIPSGVIETDPTTLSNMEDHHGHDHEHESLVLPNVYGLKHSHPACVRLDFAVDGLINKVEEHDIERSPVSEENPYGNEFVETSKLLTSELQAIRDTDFTKSRKWIVHNEFSKNYLGHERGYEIAPYPSPFPYDDLERIAKRAIYIKHALHVTKYHDGELYAAGQFVTEDDKDSGLAVYVADDENIVNEDIVVWYTLGFAHAPRTEDVPAMPRHPVGFKISPHNFYNENPGLYIPKTQIITP
jgi:primary-amine oxidase